MEKYTFSQQVVLSGGSCCSKQLVNNFWALCGVVLLVFSQLGVVVLSCWAVDGKCVEDFHNFMGSSGFRVH